MTLLETWRVIPEDGCPAPRGLAVDEALVGSVAKGTPPTLHLYTFKPAVIIGRFQDLLSEVKVEECRRLGIDVNRRTTGGGAILMSEGCLGLAFVAPLCSLHLSGEPDTVFATFGNVLVRALKALGILASYRPKNDIEVGGRKIAGIGADLEHEGILLFHASILADFDTDLMLRVLNLPFIKVEDKAIASFRDRVTTIKRECGLVPLSTVRQAIVSSFSTHFGVTLSEGTLTRAESQVVDHLVESKYGKDEWVYSVRAPKRSGQAAFKTPAGLVRVSVSVVKGVISAALIHGDFFASERDVFALESAVKWKPLAGESVLTSLKTVENPLLASIGADRLAQAIYDAGLGPDDRREKCDDGNGGFGKP